MDNVITTIFTLSIIFLLYIYFLYPLILRIIPARKVNLELFEHLPKVTVIIPAFNEESVIKQTILNKLEQSFPSNLIEIIVVSDESTDDTDNIVLSIAQEHPNVTLLRQVPRKGKTSGVNAAVKFAKGEILIFSDANSIFEHSSIENLVNSFQDPTIGYVTGKMLYTTSDGNLVGDGCSAYMKYENYLRAEETRISSVVGVDGGVDAMRKSLYSELRADQLPDFVQPLKVIEQGFRVAYQDKSLLHESALDDHNSEFKMRVRVSLRAFWALWDMKHLMNPLKYKLFAWQLLSHKTLRYLAFIPMFGAFISAFVLSYKSGFWLLMLITQLAFYLLAWSGHKNPNSNSTIVKLSYYFCLVNFAAMLAFIDFLKGKKIVTWKPRTS